MITGSCKEPHCEDAHYSKGYCKSHYNKNYQSPVVDGRKRCSGCKGWLPVSEFGGVKKLNPECRSCHRIRSAKRMENPLLRAEHQQRSEESRIRRRDSNRTRLVEYLLAHPCVDCGELDPVVLDFDHVRGIKKKAISQLLSSTWLKIEEEIRKCEVRCANCHRRKTHIQFNWWGGGGDANEF